MTSAGIAVGDTVSVAIETNGRGFIGFLVELPGAFVRGRSEAELLSKAAPEARSYLDWLGVHGVSPSLGRIVERHHCRLNVEDADGEILLAADKSPMKQDEFGRLRALALKSGETFVSLYNSCHLRDWVDSSRVRRTFYGDTPKTIREVFDHVDNTQHYYLSRVGLDIERKMSFLGLREAGIDKIEELFRNEGNSVVYDVDSESWTIKKVLRRFIWHDRIHGKAMTRILARQKQLGLIKNHEDPFCFGFR